MCMLSAPVVLIYMTGFYKHNDILLECGKEYSVSKELANQLVADKIAVLKEENHSYFNKRLKVKYDGENL